jgi:hypothetical protein
MSRKSTINRATRRMALAVAGAGLVSSIPGGAAAAAPSVASRSALKDLYDSEINFSIVTFWHGMEVKLGDEMNGFLGKTSVLEFAEEWLTREAIKHFPDSVFALMYVTVSPGARRRRDSDSSPTTLCCKSPRANYR